MASTKSAISHRQILALLAVCVLLILTLPSVFGVKSPRMTPIEALSPLEIAALEAKALRLEITALEERVALLSARNQLAQKAQRLAVEKTKEADLAFEAAEEEAVAANQAFAAADVKGQEAKDALAYARMTEKQARAALLVANEKEKSAQLALSAASQLQDEANKVLAQAQTQSRLARVTLDEIADLEAKIAELTKDLADGASGGDARGDVASAEAESKKAVTGNDERRVLPNPGKAVLAYQDGLVPSHNLVKIPEGLGELSVSARKKRFVEVLLPLILKANNVLADRRAQVEKAIDDGDEAVLLRMAKLYGLAGDNAPQGTALGEALLARIAPVPASLAMAQAAVESGWGLSRFTREGNALFGQWAWRADQGIKPLDASNDRAVIRSFTTIYDSIFAYMHNLNTHYAYQGFRDERAVAIASGERLSGLKLARYLTAYAEIGGKYVYTLQSMILHNRFDLFETYQLKG